MLTTKHVSRLFNISRETVRVWAREFNQYLSPSARPEKGQKRVYTDSDLEVFALIAEQKDAGLVYEQIHTMLQSGERGKAPDSEIVIVAGQETQKVVALQRQIIDLERELQTAQSDRAMQAGQITELRQQLTAAQQEIKQLNREIGRLQASADES